jgi:predicted nucleic acid-binding protein
VPSVVSNTGPLIAPPDKANTIILPTIGTLGVLLLAKTEGLVPVLEPLLKSLCRAGFHMSDQLYDQVLDSAGEKR